MPAAAAGEDAAFSAGMYWDQILLKARIAVSWVCRSAVTNLPHAGAATGYAAHCASHQA
jgi:hypothetical protein